MLSFGQQAHPALQDQVTPHKAALHVVAQELWALLYATPHQLISVENAYTEREERELIFTMLQLVQSPDMELKDLMNKLQLIAKPQLMNNIVTKLKELNAESVQALMDLFQNRDGMPSTAMQKSSFLGLFWRRMNLSFDKLSFNQVTQLHSRYRQYYSAWSPPSSNTSDAFTGGDSMDDASMSMQEMMESTPRPQIQPAPLPAPAQGLSGAEKGKYSRRQAEYFIARQAALLQHNEQEALSPRKLQQKVVELLTSNSHLAEAHYLSYMNSLRVFEYCGAVDSLLHYFDRQVSLSDGAPPGGNAAGGAQKPKPDGTDPTDPAANRSYRYAALSLCATHFRFGHRAEALAAVQGAIRLAQEANDHVCLQHSLFWLQRLGVQGNSNSAFLLEKLVSKSGDLNLAYLTSLGVQEFALHNALSTAQPSTVFEYLGRSDIVNCQNSQSDLMCVSYSQKAALWALYGNREMCSLSSQLMLNLNTEDLSVYHNGEVECLGLCQLARLHAQQGLYTMAVDILASAKQRYPVHTQHAHMWMLYEQQHAFERAIIENKLHAAEQAALHMAAVNEPEAKLCNCILLKEQGDVTAALELVQQLVQSTQVDTKVQLDSPDFVVRLLLLQGELLCCTDNPTEACQPFLSALTRAKQNHLSLHAATATLYLAYIQLCLDMPQQALTMLEGILVTVICNGSLVERARAQLLWIRCHVAAAGKIGEQRKLQALRLAVTLLDDVIATYRKLDAFPRVKDAVYLQARLYHALNEPRERNRCALEFRQLDEQHPTWNKSALIVL